MGKMWCFYKKVGTILFLSFMVVFSMHCSGDVPQQESRQEDPVSGQDASTQDTTGPDTQTEDANSTDTNIQDTSTERTTQEDESSQSEPLTEQSIPDKVPTEPFTEPNPPDQVTPEKSVETTPDKNIGPPEQKTDCNNGQKDPGEDNVDCGGPCPACVRSIKQFGITWTFDRGYRSGTFANGDYWVLGPIKLHRISPAPANSLHGYEINPKSSSKQAFDKRGPGYDAKLMPGVPSPGKPIIVKEGSIVSSISHPTSGQCNGRSGYWPAAIGSCTRSVLKSAAILTVLTKIPPKDSFRPPYMGTDKQIKYRVSQLDYSKLSKLAPTTVKPNVTSLERQVERPWIDHIRGWSGAKLHPGDNMYNYGREISKTVGAIGLTLNLDFAKLSGNPSKRKLLIRFVQLGIDLAGMVTNGQSWPHDGGHGLGRKMPILFAGTVLNSKAILQLGAAKANGVCVYGKSGVRGSIFQEDSTTFYISDAEVKVTAGSKWAPDKRATPRRYTAKDKGIPEWGIRHSCYPTRDNFHWSATYRTINGSGNSPFVTVAHIMGLRKLWNHPPLFDFVDRWADITAGKVGTNDWDRFALSIWKAYRDNYGCRWIRDNQKDIYSQGHYICGKHKIKCTWQQSSCSQCKLAKSCSDYPDKRSKDYNPCSLSCP